MKTKDNVNVAIAKDSSGNIFDIKINDGHLVIGYIDIVSLDLTNCFVRVVRIHNTNLEEITLSGCVFITILNIYKNKLKSLDLSDCLCLKQLDCRNNKIEYLDLNIKNNPELSFIKCDLIKIENPNYFNNVLMRI